MNEPVTALEIDKRDKIHVYALEEKGHNPLMYRTHRENEWLAARDALDLRSWA